jgi:hypothetical protein
MRSSIYLILLLCTAFFSGCAGIGYSDGALMTRTWFNDRLGMELSIKPSLSGSNKTNTSASIAQSGVNRSESISDSASLGAGVLFSILKDRDLSINAMLKYFDNTAYGYSRTENFTYDSLGQLINRQYNDNSTVSYFDNHHIGILFPDVEYNVPGMKNFKIIFSLELISILIQNGGGYFTDAYSAGQDLSGYSSTYSNALNGPGRVTSFSITLPITGTQIYSSAPSAGKAVPKQPANPAGPVASPEPPPQDNLNFIKFGVMYVFN